MEDSGAHSSSVYSEEFKRAIKNAIRPLVTELIKGLLHGIELDLDHKWVLVRADNHLILGPKFWHKCATCGESRIECPEVVADVFGFRTPGQCRVPGALEVTDVRGETLKEMSLIHIEVGENGTDRARLTHCLDTGFWRCSCPEFQGELSSKPWGMVARCRHIVFCRGQGPQLWATHCVRPCDGQNLKFWDY